MKKKRSLGVIICSAIMLVFGLLLIAYVYKKALHFGPRIYIDTFHFIICASGILSVLTSFGLCMLLDWVRKLSVIFAALVSIFLIPLLLYWIIGGLLSLNRGGEWGFLYATIISPLIILSLYLWIYLTRPKVKDLFK